MVMRNLSQLAILFGWLISNLHLHETYAFDFQKRSASSSPLTSTLTSTLISTTATTTQNRNLELICIPDEEDLRLQENENINHSGHKYDSFSQGDVSINLIKGLRRKSKSYYQDVVNNVIMATCTGELVMERCVPSNSSLVAKDWNGDCIEAANFQCPLGYCERSSNCYWNSVVAGQNRTTRFPAEDYAKAELALTNLNEASYLRDLATYTLIGIIIALFLLAIWFLYFIGRYCCCCLWTSCSCCYLCSPIPKEEGYNVCLQWVIPSFMYLVGLAGIVFCGAMAFIGNEDVNVAATGTFSYVAALVQDLGLFLEKSQRPLMAVSNIVDDAAIDAFAIFNDTTYVKATALGIIASFTNFMPLHIKGLELSGNEEGYVAAQGAFTAQVTPIVDQIQDMLDTLENDVYDNVDTIQTSLDSAVSQISNFENQTFTWQSDIYDYERTELQYRPYRLMAVLGLFLTASIIVFLGFVGILVSRNYKCRKLHSLLDVAGFLSALLGSIAFILASVTLLISFVWYDVCEISEILTSDFEPILGESIAKGANAVFNDTNLAVAFNVTDKIDFEEKLDKGLDVIKDVNITEQFSTVLDPLEDIQASVGSISSTALDYLNIATQMSFPGCMFGDKYSEDNILQPWLANDSKGNTTWKISQTGEYGNYARQGAENATQYIARIYSVAGKCGTSSGSCCLNGDCNKVKNDACNKGDNCVYPFGCTDLANGINAGYVGYLQAYDTQQRMTADLGVICPSKLSDSTPLSCPTPEFIALGNDKTLVSLVTAYGSNITNTATSLANIATTSVGDAMTQVQKFLCNMNVSFVAGRYNQVRDEVCGTMLGGFAQINFSLWMAAICLEIIAILANMLSTRLKGISKREAMELEEGGHILRNDIRDSMTKDHSYV